MPCEACDRGCVGSSKFRSVRGERTPTPLNRGDDGEYPLALTVPPSICVGWVVSVVPTEKVQNFWRGGAKPRTRAICLGWGVTKRLCRVCSAHTSPGFPCFLPVLHAAPETRAAREKFQTSNSWREGCGRARGHTIATSAAADCGRRLRGFTYGVCSQSATTHCSASSWTIMRGTVSCCRPTPTWFCTRTLLQRLP